MLDTPLLLLAALNLLLVCAVATILIVSALKKTKTTRAAAMHAYYSDLVTRTCIQICTFKNKTHEILSE